MRRHTKFNGVALLFIPLLCRKVNLHQFVFINLVRKHAVVLAWQPSFNTLKEKIYIVKWHENIYCQVRKSGGEFVAENIVYEQWGAKTVLCACANV